jgi:hypothetical protein
MLSPDCLRSNLDTGLEIFSSRTSTTDLQAVGIGVLVLVLAVLDMQLRTKVLSWNFPHGNKLDQNSQTFTIPIPFSF